MIHRVIQTSYSKSVYMYIFKCSLTWPDAVIHAYASLEAHSQRSTYILLMDVMYFPHRITRTHTHTHMHTRTPVVRPSLCSLLTCVECPACRARAACHCLGSVMDVPFVAHTQMHRQTDRQWRAQLACPVHPEDEFLLCLGKRM